MYRVIEQSDRVLQFRYQRPVIFGSVFILGGLLALLVFGRTSEIELSRTTDGSVDCHVQSSSFGLFTRERTFRGITGASVERRRSREGGSTYRVLLETRTGEQPMTSSSDSNRSGKEELRQKIERFVKSDDVGPWRTVESPPIFIWLFVVLFPAAGLAVILLGGGEVRLDRDADHVVLRRGGLLGGGTREYPLREVREFTVRSSAGRKSTTYGVVMRMADGEEVPLRRLKDSGFRKKQELVQLLEDFRSRANAERAVPSEQALPGKATDSAVAPMLCAVCGWDCSNAERVQDADGRHYHKECYEWRRRGGQSA